MDIGRADIDRWHRSRGWLGIGYHYVIRRDGELEMGRSHDVVGAHAKGHNSTSVGVCMVGGVGDLDATPREVSENNFTGAQWQTLDVLLRTLNDLYPHAQVIGHNEVSSKDCPSFDVQLWLRASGLESMAKAADPELCSACGQRLPPG